MYTIIASLQVSLDPSGLYAAASSADKTVVLFDIFSGECVTKLYGHSGRYLPSHVHVTHIIMWPVPCTSGVITGVGVRRGKCYITNFEGGQKNSN